MRVVIVLHFVVYALLVAEYLKKRMQKFDLNNEGEERDANSLQNTQDNSNIKKSFLQMRCPPYNNYNVIKKTGMFSFRLFFMHSNMEQLLHNIVLRFRGRGVSIGSIIDRPMENCE
jgi:hypothetical protein